MRGSSVNVNRVLLATESFVSALNKVIKDQHITVAFGKSALADGRELVKCIDIDGSDTTAVGVKIAQILQLAVYEGHNGVKEE